MSEQRRLATLAVVVLAGAGLLFGWLYWRAERGRQPAASGWFDALAEAPPPPEAAVRATAEWLRDRFLAGGTGPPPDGGDTLPRFVFLSLGDGLGPAAVVSAAGDGLADAAHRALALAEARRAERVWRDLKVDVVTTVAPPQETGRRDELTFERGLDGLALTGAKLAFLPEEVVVRTLVTGDREMRASNVERYLRWLDDAEAERADRLWSRGKTTVRTFRTRAYFTDGGRLVPLYRGHRERRPTAAGELLEAAVSAGDYLRRAVADDGRFVYAYLPKTDEEKDDYNMLRHAGTAYSMAELFEVTRDPALLAAAERALDFLRGRVVECRAGDGWGSCVEEKGYVKLGGNALAILAFAKHAAVTGNHDSLPLMRRLGQWMLGVQEESGEFSIHKLHLESGEVDDLVSEYYPGEALFALSRLYELDGDRRWLDAAERGARWLITVRDDDLSDDDLSHDHWLLYALNELYARQPRPLYADHALRLARVIAASQNRSPEFPDWRGSYYRPPRSTPTATRSEGLCAAWELARRSADEAEAAEILEAARLGVEFQLQLQFRPESTLYLPNPRRALGGFPRSLINFEIRIDYVQHSLSSFLALRRALLELDPGT